MTTRTAVPIFGWTNRSSKPSRKRAPLTRSLPLRVAVLEGILEERNRWLLQSDLFGLPDQSPLLLRLERTSLPCRAVHPQPTPFCCTTSLVLSHLKLAVDISLQMLHPELIHHRVCAAERSRSSGQNQVLSLRRRTYLHPSFVLILTLV